MQRALIKWWAGACGGFGVPECLLFSVPNGGGGGARRGHWLQLEGCRRGAPDLMLACRGQSRGLDQMIAMDLVFEYPALFLELKTPTGILSLDQQTFHGILRASGYQVEVCRSLEEAQKVITEYLTK